MCCFLCFFFFFGAFAISSGCHLRLAVTCRITLHGVATPLPPYFKTAWPLFDLPRPFMAEAASKPRCGNFKASISPLSLPLLLSSSAFFFSSLSFLSSSSASFVQTESGSCQHFVARNRGEDSLARLLLRNPATHVGVDTSEGFTSQSTINWIVSKTQCWFNDATRLRGHRSQRILSFELMHSQPDEPDLLPQPSLKATQIGFSPS